MKKSTCGLALILVGMVVVAGTVTAPGEPPSPCLLSPRIVITHPDITRLFSEDELGSSQRGWEYMYTKDQNVSYPNWFNAGYRSYLKFIFSRLEGILRRTEHRPVRILDMPSGRGLLARHIKDAFSREYKGGELLLTTSDIIMTPRPLPYGIASRIPNRSLLIRHNEQQTSDERDLLSAEQAYLLKNMIPRTTQWYRLINDLVPAKNKKTSYRHIIADARSLPVKADRFDVIISTFFLSYLSPADRALVVRNFYHSLSPGGSLIVLLHHKDSEHTRIASTVKNNALAVIAFLGEAIRAYSITPELRAKTMRLALDQLLRTYDGPVPRQWIDLADQTTQLPPDFLENAAKLVGMMRDIASLQSEYAPFESLADAKRFFARQGFSVSHAASLSGRGNESPAFAMVLAKDPVSLSPFSSRSASLQAAVESSI